MDPVPGRKSEPSTPSERIEGKRRAVEWSQRRCVPLVEMIGPKLKENSSFPSWTKVVPSPAKLSTMEWW